MAEFLIKSVDHNGFLAGDVIFVQADGLAWGREESLEQWVSEGRPASEFPSPESYIIAVPGYPVDENFLEPWLDSVVEGGVAKQRVRERKLWRFNLPGFTAEEQAAIAAPGGRAVLSWAQAGPHLVRKDTGAAAPNRRGGGQGKRRYSSTEQKTLDLVLP